MNKLFKCLSTAVLGIAMAVGVGVGVASGVKVSEVDAESKDITLSTDGGTSATKYTIKLMSEDGGTQYEGIKAGANKSSGKIIVKVGAGATKLKIHIAAWNGDNPSVSISGANISPSDSFTPKNETNLSGSSTTITLSQVESTYYKEFSLSNITTETSIAFSTSSNKKRFAIWHCSYDVGTTCNHNWQPGTVHPASCTEEGYTEYTCSLCKGTKNDDIVPALGHNWFYDVSDHLDHCSREGCNATREHLDAILFNPETCTSMSGVAGKQEQEIENVSVLISQGLVSESLRIYKSQTLTISSLMKITKVEFVCVEKGTTKYGPGCLSVSVGTYSFEENGPNGVWQGEANSIVFTASTDQTRVLEMKVYMPSYSYAVLFLSAGLCDNGVTQPSTDKWAELSESFAKLSENDKDTFTSIDVIQVRTQIEKCVERYDYIVGKYSSEKYADFMERNPSPINEINPLVSLNNIQDTTWIVVIVGLVGLTAVGGYFFIRRRKEN